jgi:hypothetical protein
MKKSRQIPLVVIALGAFTIYWAQTHSPKAGVGQIMGNAISGSYTMSETNYYICLGLGIALAAFGVYRFVTSK